MATPKAARPWITGTYKSKKGEKYEPVLLTPIPETASECEYVSNLLVAKR